MMRLLHIPTLLAVLLGTAGVSWLVLMLAEGSGKYLPPVPLLALVMLAALTGTVLFFGRRVRAYLMGKRPNLDPLVAARTLGLAQAAAWGGVLMGGWYAGQVLITMSDWGIESRRATAFAAMVAVGLALVLSAAGIIVERWCRLSGDTDEGPLSSQQVEQ